MRRSAGKTRERESERERGRVGDGVMEHSARSQSWWQPDRQECGQRCGDNDNATMRPERVCDQRTSDDDGQRMQKLAQMVGQVQGPVSVTTAR